MRKLLSALVSYWTALTRSRADERRALLILETDTALVKETHGALDDPDEGENGEREGRPVDESARGLVREDGPQGPGDRSASGQVTLGGSERVGGSGALEEEEGNEDEDLGPDTGTVGESVDAKRLEGGDNDEDGGPAVVEREGEVDEDFVAERLRSVVLLGNVVDAGYRAADQECNDESENVVAGGPEIYVDGVNDAEEREVPGNAIDDDAFALGSKLVNDSSQEKRMDDSPDKERPRCGGYVGLFSRVVDTGWRRNRVQIRPEEEYVGQNVSNLDDDAIGQRVRHDRCRRSR